MTPWLWFWAPRIHLPWSGGVAQQIDPNLGWFFDAIRPGSGDGTVEREAFEVASYGKQLGLLSEALLGLSGRGGLSAAQTTAALDRLEEIRLQIEAIKTRRSATAVDALAVQLEDLRARQPQAYQTLMQRLEPDALPPSA